MIKEPSHTVAVGRGVQRGLYCRESEELWEPWMRQADQALDDARGRPGATAEVILRLLVLKHIRDGSFEELDTAAGWDRPSYINCISAWSPLPKRRRSSKGASSGACDLSWCQMELNGSGHWSTPQLQFLRQMRSREALRTRPNNRQSRDLVRE